MKIQTPEQAIQYLTQLRDAVNWILTNATISHNPDSKSQVAHPHYDMLIKGPKGDKWGLKLEPDASEIPTEPWQPPKTIKPLFTPEQRDLIAKLGYRPRSFIPQPVHGNFGISPEHAEHFLLTQQYPK